MSEKPLPTVSELALDFARRWVEKHGTPEEQERKAWENFRRMTENIKPGDKITIRRPTRAHTPSPSVS
jgi:hypothetical protein